MKECVLLTPMREVSHVNILGKILNFVFKDKSMGNILLWLPPASIEN